MSTDIRSPRPTPAQALDESLAAWLGWFNCAPLPEDMAALVDQLEAAYAQSTTAKSAERVEA